MKDFTITSYTKMLETLFEQGFSFQTFAGFIDKPKDRLILLRHDVDARKGGLKKNWQISQLKVSLKICRD